MLERIGSWKYGIAVLAMLGLCIYVSNQSHRTWQQYEEKCYGPNKSAPPPGSYSEDCDKGADSAARHLPAWYRAFSWPEGVTAWAILLTLFTISEQTNQTRRAAEATFLSAQALVNAERARIGFDVSKMGRSFQIDGKNNGKTSARIMYAHGFTKILAHGEDLPSVPSYIGAPDDSSEWIGPGETFDLLIATDRYGLFADLSEVPLCERIRDKKAVLWVFGCIRYFDGVSSEERERRFCFATSVDSDLETYLYHAGPDAYRCET